MKKVLYFAYGSNMFSGRIEFRITNPIKAGTHKLYGWKLKFNAESDYGCQSYANIVKGTKTDFVEGVLYDLTHAQYRILDQFEGLYERMYFDIDSKTLGCAYVCRKDATGNMYQPDEYYFTRVLQGAIENGLDATTAHLINLKEQIDFGNLYRPKINNDY